MSHANSRRTGHPRQELILTLPGQPLKSSKICVGAGGHLNRATGDSRDSKGSDPVVLLRGLLILELGSYRGCDQQLGLVKHTENYQCLLSRSVTGRSLGLTLFQDSQGKNGNPGSGSDPPSTEVVSDRGDSKALF